MKKLALLTIILAAFFFANGCQQEIDIAKEKAEIMNLVKGFDKGLTNGDINAVTSSFAKNEEEINILNGNLLKISFEDNKKKFEDAISNGKYLEANYKIEPIIHLSLDGSMAWVAGKTGTNYQYKDSTGTVRTLEDNNAWLWVFEKKDSKWISSAIAQSFESK